jgi:hypothetical protein
MRSELGVWVTPSFVFKTQGERLALFHSLSNQNRKLTMKSFNQRLDEILNSPRTLQLETYGMLLVASNTEPTEDIPDWMERLSVEVGAEKFITGE